MALSTRRRTLRALTAVVGIQWMGATLGLPLLPLFLERRGGSPTSVGLVMASFFVAGLATQFAIGHLVDRFGRRRLLVAGLLAYGGGAATFLLPIGALWFTASRALQGAGAGAIEVTSLSAVAVLFPEGERGRALSRIFAAQLLGAALGPVAGSVASVGQLQWAFLATGVASTIAAVRALRMDLGGEGDPAEPLPPLQRNGQLYGALAAAAAVGICVGVYEACWSLLMRHYGASSLEIRLSWTLFCLPFFALSRVGGWLADHGNRKVIAIFGTWNAALFLFIYPHLHHVPLMLATGPLESIGGALSLPSTMSLLSQGGSPREMGRRQGLSTTAQTAALALGAACAGSLYSIRPDLPFDVVALVSAVLTATMWWWWRDVVGPVSRVDATTAAPVAPPSSKLGSA